MRLCLSGQKKNKFKKIPNQPRKRLLKPERKNTLSFLKIAKKEEKEKTEKTEQKCLMYGAGVSCGQCIKCEKTEVQNCGRSLCFDAKGVVSCGYSGLCSRSKEDVVACKLYIRK